MMIRYRELTDKEISILKNQNCRVTDSWKNIQVTEDFDTSFVHQVTFSGKNKIGKLGANINLHTNITDHSGVYNAHIHNCTIGDNCYIKNIGTCISNYHIEDNVTILNTGSLITEGETYFGNGVEVCPVNEGGGRNVIIYNELSSHIAYLMVFYRHQPKLITSLKKEILTHIESFKSTTGKIKKNATIINCNTITNINIGEAAIIDNVTFLNNGTILSSHAAPTSIKNGVNASDFIVSDGSVISDGATLRHCFVGQGCEIGNLYTAENSLFFANSQCLQGEACSIFAGPYTVTHHKSTLLIAGYYSFFNAGSGTNQSNHMYKLGPVHQGLIERGGKTGSDSYVLWPAQVGAFTMILGRHYSNPDISLLPFSYLIEDGGKSALMPGHNLFNVGITRDVQKWPNRDKRKGNEHSDFIITEALNPYTINKIISGIEVLKQLQEKASPQGKSLMYKNTQIALTSIKRGIKLYEQALIKYVGDELVNVLKQPNFDKTKINFNTNSNDWVDVSGLICKTDALNHFINGIEGGDQKLENWNSFFKEQYSLYQTVKLEHALAVLKNQFEIDMTSCSNADLISFITTWKENNAKIKASIISDAKKEFNVKSKIGFGIDGDAVCRESDFLQVRGEVDNNSFITNLNEEHEQNEHIANTLIEGLK